MSEPKTSEQHERSERAADVFAAALARIEGGEELELRALAGEHPELALELERLCARWEQLESGMARYGAAPSEVESEKAWLEPLKASGRRPERYRSVGEIARGGMGAIFEVYDKDLERLSAKKVADLASVVGSQGRRARLARFLREARITGRLEHPGIVPVHDLGVDENERPFFTMPLVRGHDLRTVYEWVRDGRADWSVARVLGVLLKVCEAVSYAHSRGVLHRDLKPANVMVGRYGEVHVMDWGLAKLSEHEEGEPRSGSWRSLSDSWTRLTRVADADADDSALETREGDVLGTPFYMPPEQAAGKLDEVDERADVYAIGAMLYHLLAGEAPYGDLPGSSSAHAVLTSLVTRPPTPLAQIAPQAPPEVVAICERAMARERDDRYASVGALGDDLRALLEGRVVTAYERGTLAQLRKWVRRNRALAALLALLVVSTPIAASLATYVISTRDDVVAAERQARAARVESALEEGYLELGEGDAELALARFDAALALDASSLEAIAGRAFARSRLERYEEALETLARVATEAEPGLAMLRADALRALGRHEEAALLAEVEAREPSTPLAAYLAAQSELRRGHAGDDDAFARAVRLLERSARLSRNARPLYAYELSHALGHTTDDARALEMAEMLETLWPDAPSSMHWAGFARAGAGELERGTELLERALALRPESPVHHFGLAWASMKAGELDVAAQLFEEFLLAEPDSFAGHQNLAVLHRQRGDFAAAIEAARRAVALKPDRAIAHWTLAANLDMDGQAHEALPPFREALRLDPGLRACRRQYAEALVRAGQRVEALAELRRMVETDPSEAKTWSRLGVVQLLAGEPEQAARESLAQALLLDPVDPAAHMQLGLLAGERGERAQAAKHYEAALVGDPNASRAHYNLGNEHLHFERFEQAVACYERALRFEPGLPHAHCNLGHALRSLGRYDAALESFRRGHELGMRRASWTHPSEQWIRETEALMASESRLGSVLADPTSVPPAECAALARHAVETRRGVLALPLFERAFEQEPALFESPRERFLVFAARAACATANAAGVEPERARAASRLALEWLEADLAALETALAAGDIETDFVAESLTALFAEADFAAVRDAAALERLSSDEATAWGFYWEAVEGLRAALSTEDGR